MEIKGNIATPLELKQARNGGASYYEFRFAENQGKGDKRTTTWYTVRAFVSELDADLLASGMYVLIRGRLDVQPYIVKTGPKTGQAAAINLVFTSSIEPIQVTSRDEVPA
jgi:single-stranded DNA-binding protein